MMDVTAGTKHRAEALAFMNEIIGPLSQLGMVIEFNYGPTTNLLAPILANYPDLAKKLPASPADLKALNPINWEIFNAKLPKAVQLWDRQVISK